MKYNKSSNSLEGKQAVIDYFSWTAREYPNKQVYFKRAIDEGDYVFLHCLQVWPKNKEKNFFFLL